MTGNDLGYAVGLSKGAAGRDLSEELFATTYGKSQVCHVHHRVGSRRELNLIGESVVEAGGPSRDVNLVQRIIGELLPVRRCIGDLKSVVASNHDEVGALTPGPEVGVVGVGIARGSGSFGVARGGGLQRHSAEQRGHRRNSK